ncbi:MAG: hypothetical protein BGO01_18875 [Armatimonadetes bacterium 55-13]|nr:hypothetical protein [Armatimonadota bacterium]OJU64190.1 MAG: hypothetical protein BGO01_18875 [Armatimonadetes bacterium 55-13]
MNRLNFADRLKKWLRSHRSLVIEVEALRQENADLRQKIASLHNEKDRTEKSLEERRREKEALRTRLNSQKKASETSERTAKQLGEKVTELREENERLRQKDSPPPED